MKISGLDPLKKKKKIAPKRVDTHSEKSYTEIPKSSGESASLVVL